MQHCVQLPAIAARAPGDEPLANLGDWVWEATSGALTFSPQLLRVYGIEADALSSVRDTFLVRVHPSDRARTHSAVRRALRAGGPFNFDQRIVRADGAVRLLRTRGHVARDQAGKCVRILGISQDITTERSKRARANAEQSYGRMIDSARGYAMLLLDADGKIVSWDPGAVRMFSQTAEQMNGASIAALYPPEDALAGVPTLHLRAAESELRSEREGWRVRGDGTRFWSHSVLFAVRDGSQNVTGFVCVIQDLTWRRRIEDQFRTQRERLVSAAQTVADADETERRRTGLELRDTVGQPLAALEKNLQIIGTHLPKDGSEAALLDESLRELRGVAQRAQHIADQLRRAPLEEHGLLVALQIAAGRLSRQAAIPVHVSGEHDPSPLRIGVEAALHEVALDVLDSAVKRSRCTLVRVSLEQSATFTRLKVSDDGQVRENDTASARAVSASAQARAEAAGIAIHTTTQPGMGTCVSLEYTSVSPHTL